MTSSRKREKQYDLIVIGSGSAMNFVDLLIQQNPDIKIAVIDKDETGGICLTRGCIPSKIMLYPAELVRMMDGVAALGIDVEFKGLSFEKIMARTRSLIDEDIDSIRNGLSSSENIDYFHAEAEFVAPYQMKVDDKVIAGKMIFLATGSKATVPPIKGLEAIRYHTSDSVIRMEMKKRPKSIAIIGAGYIGAEFGHFFAAVGSQVTIIGRNPQFLPEEEPEVSALAKRELGKHMTILTNHDVIEVQQTAYGMKKLVAVERQAGAKVELEAEEILVATGRGPLNDILHPEKAGVTTTREGWIQVDEYLETTQPNVWAFGDADGKYPFRHVANYESEVVYANAVLKRKVKVDYHAIPHAVFTYPEIASVGMKESEAVQKHGKENVLIGFYRYEDTAKGEAMNVKDYFVKVIIERSSRRILGAHIIGPSASILIHEIIAAMYAPTRSAEIISDAIHIHPSLSEVVQRAIGSPMPVEHYHHHFGAEIEAPR